MARELSELLSWSESRGSAAGGDLRRVLAAGGVVARVVERFRAQIGLWS